MKKTNLTQFHIFLILIFSVIVMIPMMLHFSYVGHDIEFHFLNIKSMVHSLSWNNWFIHEPLSFLANDFGYGTPFFYPPLPHLIATYIAKFLQILSINDILISIRITDWLTIFFSGISFYILAKKIFKSNKVILLGTFFYMSAPYHVAEIYIRDAFSEMFIFIAVPFIVLGLLELKDKNFYKFYFYFTLGYTISIYSHMAMSIFLTILLLLTFFILYFKQMLNKQSIKYLLFSCISILCLTAPFWLSLIEMKLSTDYSIFVPYLLTGKGDLQYSTLKFLDYFHYFLPHTYNYIRYHLQFSVSLFLCGSVFVFFKNKLWKDKTVLFILLFFAFSIFMTTKLFPWAHIPSILHTLQFPWRLTLFVQFSGILFALYFLDSFSTKKWFSIFFIVMTLVCVGEMFYNTYHLDKVFHENEMNIDLGMGNQREYLPYKTALHMTYFDERNQDIFVLDGNATIHKLEDHVPTLLFEVEVDKKSTVELPRLYYPGYQLKCNHNFIKLQESENGFLQATIEETGTCTLKYTGTKLQKTASTIAILSFIINFLVLLFFKKEKSSSNFR